MYKFVLTFVLLSGFYQSAYADCDLDRNGVVICGRGEYAKDITGNVYCPAVESGGANQDRFGVVKCYGGCELASTLMCENQEGR